MTADEAAPLRAAALALTVALTGLAGLLVLVLSGPDGTAAVAAIGGLSDTSPTGTDALRWAIAADTLLPIGYGAGFCLMAAGLARDPTAKMIALTAILATLLGVTCDFLENGFVLSGAPVRGLTVVKYGTLGLAAFTLGALLPGGTGLQTITRIASQIVAPVFLAGLISGMGPVAEPLPFVLTLAMTFVLLASTAMQIARST